MRRSEEGSSGSSEDHLSHWGRSESVFRGSSITQDSSESSEDRLPQSGWTEATLAPDERGPLLDGLKLKETLK